MSKHIILGDVHLGKGVKIGKPGAAGSLNSRIKDQIRLLDWVLETAISNNCYHIIITGDVFEDYKPHHNLIKIFIDWVINCSANNVLVDVIAGNHDMQRTGTTYNSALDIFDSINISKAAVYKDICTVEFGDISFTYLPFRDRRGLGCDTHDQAIDILKNKLSYEISSISQHNIKVCVGHLTLLGAIPVGDEIDDMTNELMCAPDMFTGYDYVFMGHIHKPQVRNKKPYHAHIGSMDISDFGETDHIKRIIMLDSEAQGVFREINIPTRPLMTLRIDVPLVEDATVFVSDKILEMNSSKPIKSAIIRLEIKLAAKNSENVNRQKIEELIYSLGAHHICNFSETRSVVVVNINKEDSIDNTMDISQALKLWSDTKISDDNKEDFIKEAMEVYSEFQAGIK